MESPSGQFSMKPAKTPKASWIKTSADRIGQTICNFFQRKIRNSRLVSALLYSRCAMAASGNWLERFRGKYRTDSAASRTLRTSADRRIMADVRIRAKKRNGCVEEDRQWTRRSR